MDTCVIKSWKSWVQKLCDEILDFTSSESEFWYWRAVMQYLCLHGDLKWHGLRSLHIWPQIISQNRKQIFESYCPPPPISPLCVAHLSSISSWDRLIQWYRCADGARCPTQGFAYWTEWGKFCFDSHFKWWQKGLSPVLSPYNLLESRRWFHDVLHGF